MIKQISSLEVEISGKKYQFICDGNSPLGGVHDAMCQMKAYIIERINEAHKLEKEAKKPESVEQDEVKDEVQDEQ